VAREAALEADTAAKAVQAAVATARMKAQAATNTTDPSIAAEAGEDALAAERAVKTATSNAMKEAEVARAAAVAAVEAKNQVVGIAEKMARSAPSDVKKVPDTGTIDPRKKGIVSPPPLTGTRTSRNEIRNFRAENISDVELKVVVDYTYIGDKGMGGRLIAIQACAEQANGQLTPGTACWNRPVTAGDGSATIHIKLSNATGTFVSSVVRVCMLGPSADPSKSRGERFYCESFPYAKVWRR
jgi:hypothetical protein